MIRCIIIEDEPLAQEILETHIRQIPQLNLLAKCYNALEAFNMLHTNTVDLMFLDIKMPDINGIDFIRSLKHPPQVIFTTAYSEYAITGYELSAIDYLLKPITFERFEKSINKMLKIQNYEHPPEKNYTYFKVSGKLIKVFHDELLYAQSVKDYILIHTNAGNFLTHMTMKHLVDLLPARNFARVHRSFLINTNAIDLLKKNSLKIGNDVIPIGQNYRFNAKPNDLKG
ncbi:LytTR family DNA-binding domain-containing protein [Pedobacter sp. Leaf176]|uniref:LytR/AlgR family response regulator transcription factor n=1 Tax=Pedobacter sp. Leaf176 TaxID=1736286 RepID=UPI00070140D3|nr:LytTR family DNA-binding domain-containing protein [Pedobacter sp. Leaf176]KQR71746.1 LytTR family transcriptional regulator [Pedobacter sp. Leaf176]